MRAMVLSDKVHIVPILMEPRRLNMFTVELEGLRLILEWFLDELRLEAALEDFREHSSPGDASCPFTSFPFPFN